MPVRVGSNSSKSKVNCLSNSKLNLEELFKDIEYLNSSFLSVSLYFGLL